jgi:hypothetical protein
MVLNLDVPFDTIADRISVSKVEENEFKSFNSIILAL